MPYRTMDNFISGAVLTFTKITPLKALEKRLSSLMSFMHDCVAGLEDPALILDQDRKVLAVNDKFLKFFNFRDFEIREQFLLEVVHNKWNTDKLDSIIADDVLDSEIYLQHDFPGVGNKKMIVAVERKVDIEKKETGSIIISFKEKESG